MQSQSASDVKESKERTAARKKASAAAASAAKSIRTLESAARRQSEALELANAEHRKRLKKSEEALRVATTIKLTRALWIIPLAIATSFIFKSKGQKISIPWFIFFFVLAMIVNTYVLNLSETGALIGAGINSIARKALTITLFFIGASLSRDVLKAVGIKPLVQGILLWVVISVSTLAYIYWS